MTGRLIFEEVNRSRRQLVLNYRVDDLVFSTTYWYDTVNFYELEDRFGRDFMRRIYFHLLAFEANKAASLKPAVLDAGPYQVYCSDQFFTVWQTIFRNVWGVWRHDNNIVDYFGPEPAHAGRDQTRPSGGWNATLLKKSCSSCAAGGKIVWRRPSSWSGPGSNMM